jgi:hypothetical protein
MVAWVWDRMSDRKRRLFAVACCRRRRDVMDAEGRRLLDLSERFARGLVGRAQLEAAHQAAYGALEEICCPGCAEPHDLAARLACYCASQARGDLEWAWRDAFGMAGAVFASRWQYYDDDLARRVVEDERKAVCALLRELSPALPRRCGYRATGAASSAASSAAWRKKSSRRAATA